VKNIFNSPRSIFNSSKSILKNRGKHF